MKNISRTKIILGIFLLQGIFLTVLYSRNLVIPEIKWSKPIQLSPADQFSWFPTVVSDSENGLHVAWSSGVLGFDTVLYSYSPDGETWTTPNDIAADSPAGYATRPFILVGKDNKLHMSYHTGNGIFYSNANRDKANLVSSWSEPIQVSTNIDAYFSSMVQDSHNTLHLLYTEGYHSGSCKYCYHLFYRRSSDSGKTWTNPVDISQSDNGAAKPQMIMDKNENIYVVWEAGLGGDLGQLDEETSISFTYSRNRGESWASPITFSYAKDSIGKNPAIGLDGSNNLFVVWSSSPDDLVIYQYSEDEGRTWSNPQSIIQLWGGRTVFKTKLDHYSIATDSNGNIHLVIIGRKSADQKNLDLMDVMWNGYFWLNPYIIATYDEDVPEWPQVSISQGNQLNVVWYVRDQAHIWDTDKGHYTVWYSRGDIVGLPMRSTTEVITDTPGNEPTPTHAISPTTLVTKTEVSKTPVLQKTTVPDLKPIDDVPISEMDYVKILFMGIIPSLVLIVIVVIVIVVRRK